MTRRARLSVTLVWSLAFATCAVVATNAASAATTPKATCTPAIAATRIGHLAGIQAPRLSSVTRVTCASGLRGSTPPEDQYEGVPPVIDQGGPVMDTSGVVTVTPLYWAPSGFAFAPTYSSLTAQFVSDAAHDSAAKTNVFSDLTQYGDASGHVRYDLAAGAAIDDTTPYPTTGGCTPDAGETYSDGSSYTACVTDAQIQTELASQLGIHGLPSDLSHIYLVFLPKGVESCFDTSNNLQDGECTISSVGGSYCGYHSYFGTTTIYAALPYAIYDNPVTGETCGSDGADLSDGSHLGTESPNGNVDADSVLSVVSHEMSESITDPTLDAWIDQTGNEVGDDCAYIYGDTTSFGGTAGSYYNQTINGHHYFLQEELSNANFAADPTYACVQESQTQSASFTSTAPIAPNVFDKYKVTGISSSGLPVTVSTEEFSNGLCALSSTHSGATVTFDASGVCAIDLAQTGTSTYLPSRPAHQFIYVGQVSSTTLLKLSTPAVAYGGEQAERLTVTIVPLYQGTPVSGSVSIRSQTATLCVIRLTSGSGTCTLHPRAARPGVLSLVAHYTGNKHLLASVSAARALPISKGSSRTSLLLSASSVDYGHEQSVRFTAAVASHFAGTMAIGAVTVQSGDAVLCVLRLSAGHGSCTTSAKRLAKGVHLVVARYVGSALLAGSTSGQLRLTIR